MAPVHNILVNCVFVCVCKWMVWLARSWLAVRARSTSDGWMACMERGGKGRVCVCAWWTDVCVGCLVGLAEWWHADAWMDGWICLCSRNGWRVSCLSSIFFLEKEWLSWFVGRSVFSPQRIPSPISPLLL
uniref:Uncharacterized protein n=1 Tax=Vitrella brassicaformis TaxID=1169539 RepID=A0A7S1PA94_9ALVE